MKEYQRKNRSWYLGALICVLICHAFAVALQFFKGDVLDHAIAGETAQTARYALLLIGFILCEVLFFFLYKQCSARFVVGCTRLLKRDLFESILRRDYVTFKRAPLGAYIAKYTNDADLIRTRWFQLLPLFWDMLFTILFVSAGLFLLDARIALITIGLLTTPLYVPKLIEKRLQNAQKEYLQAVEESLTKLNDWLNGFEIIKNFSVERRILREFSGVNDAALQKLLRDTTLGAVSQLITTLISYLSYFIILATAAWLVLRGEFSAGDFFVAIGMIDQLSYPMISLAEIIRQLLAIRPACREMERFIAEPRTEEPPHPLLCLRDSIAYDSVSFSYPDGRRVLQGLNFTLRMGKRYLVRGPSGCGKTTAINLLLRYYDADSGCILADGVPITQYGSTYPCITVVRQEAVLFGDTLRNNLTMGQEIAEEKLCGLLRSLGLESFASAEALDAQITENGANLSGGEKKRICLARALLRSTDVLILDEPLANLDAGTAERIEDLILSIRGRLVLVVSHQFSEGKLRQFDGVLTLRPME